MSKQRRVLTGKQMDVTYTLVDPVEKLFDFAIRHVAVSFITAVTVQIQTLQKDKEIKYRMDLSRTQSLQRIAATDPPAMSEFI